MVNVWWSACPPCRVEQPELNDAAADGQAAFVGVNIRDSSVDQARAYVRSFEVPYPSVFSADGKALVPFYGTLTAYTVPATVVLDAEGRIAASILGRLPSEQTLLDVVADTAAEGTP